MAGRILVVDDDRLKRLTLEKQLADAGYSVLACDDPFAALAALGREPFDVVLTDLRMPGMDGLTLLKRIKEAAPVTQVVVMTAYGTIETAIEAIRAGAYDYVTKPFTIEEIDLKLRHLLDHARTLREVETLRRQVAGGGGFHDLVGRSKGMREVFDRARVLAGQDVSLLILGETGTGKELLARAVHHEGPRRDEPFVAFSCAALNREILESELFGHEAGAFTGALREKRGRFELAGQGTIFLDDVDDIPLDAQVKLLRVLQERSFERVGGERALPVGARVVCATKHDLRRLVSEGRFREDLMYRLDVVRITLPPLRERKEDIPLLFAHFCGRSGRSCEVDPAAFRVLLDHDWPGNVRELENVVAQIVSLVRSAPATLVDLPAYLRTKGEVRRPYALDLGGREQLDLPALLEEIRKACIEWALVKADGNQVRAAELLNLPRTSLRRHLESGSSEAGEGTP
jgi:DNA-binding NtrC family response regulator